MRTLIIYDTKNGFTEKLCHWIQEGLTGNTDIKNVNNIETLDYDFLIIGSPVYFGSPMKSILSFLKDYQENLRKKKIAVFIVNLLKENIKIGKSELKGGDSVLQKMLKYIPEKPVITEMFTGEIDLNEMDSQSKIIINRILDMTGLSIDDITTATKDDCMEFCSRMNNIEILA